MSSAYNQGLGFGRGLTPQSRSSWADEFERRHAEREYADREAERYREQRRRKDREKEVVAGGADVLVHPAPDWALEPNTTWTRLSGNDTVYVQADEDTAIALYYARYGENPFARALHDDFPAVDVTGGWKESFVRASALDRNVSRYSPTPASNACDVILDETEPNFQGPGYDNEVLSVQQLLDSGRVTVIREGDWAASELYESAGSLRAEAEEALLSEEAWEAERYGDMDY